MGDLAVIVVLPFSLFVYFDHNVPSSPEESDEPLRHHAVRGRRDEWLRT